jgi:tetratricopeptide (TPR) repeat protein
MRKLLILLALCLLWIFSVASSPVVTGAKNRLSVHKYEDAVKVLEENKAKYPDDPELFYYLGRAYAGMAQWSAAGENFSIALEKDPSRKLRNEIDKWRDYYCARFVKEATMLMEQKRYPPAIGKFQIANIINPDRKESHANLGVALLEQAQLYESAEPPQPDSARMYYDQSIESINRAIDLEPENEQFIQSLVQAYIMAGRYDDAIDTYKAYLEAYPDDVAAKKKLDKLFEEREKTQKTFLQH